MSAKRLYQLLIAGVVLLTLALFGGTYVINSLLEKQAAELATQQRELAVLVAQGDELKQAKTDIAKYRELADIAKSIVPQDKDQAQTVGIISKLARQNNISLSSVIFPDSDLESIKKESAINLSQLTSVKGIPGVYSLILTIQSDIEQPVPYANFLAFLRDLEQNRRTAQVNAITITPNPDNPSRISFNLELQEYIKP